jgi:DNA-binding CsgD family transcriptional regulator
MASVSPLRGGLLVRAFRQLWHGQTPKTIQATGGDMSNPLQGGESGPALSEREAAVCVGIVTGHSNEAIALHLELSINSVRTYRRRAYAKLQITSQNELFALILNGGRKGRYSGH